MQITELAAKVQSLGLSDKEAKVYVAALFLGPSSVQKIAQQAEVNRATTYVILEQLCELGLVAQSTERKKTVFIAEGPEMLERLFERQLAEIDGRRRELADLMPDLTSIHRSEDHHAPVVRFYRGQEGVLNMLQEVRRQAPTGTEIYTMADYDEVLKVIPDIFKSNPAARLKKRISSKTIYSYHGEVPSDPKLLRQTIKVKEPIKADIAFYKDMAAFSTYAGKDTLGIIIESPEIVGALRQLFELAWKNRQSQ